MKDGDENIGLDSENIDVYDIFVDTCSHFRWKDKLSFPMLVKNEQTREKNVLCLFNLEADGVPDVSPIRTRVMAPSFIHTH